MSPSKEITEEDRFAGNMWKWLLGSVTFGSIIIGGIFWLARVESTAQQALAISNQNTAKIEALSRDFQEQRLILVEIKSDIRYIVQTIKENKNLVGITHGN